MSTRSAIIVKTGDQEFIGVYCHYDGYTEGVGKTLNEHYQDHEKVVSLVSLGSLSVLAERVAPVGEHSFRNPEDGTTIAYHRDRDEELHVCKGRSVIEVAEQIGHNGYVYSLEDGKWSVNGVSLEEELAGIDS